MTAPITATHLYNRLECPHRVHLDAFGDPSKRDPVGKFVEMLWERGTAYETRVITDLGLPFTNLRAVPAAEAEAATLAAMDRGEALIYGGRLSAGELLGAPDLLRRQGTGYVAGDIKSGRADEGGSDEEPGKPKKHYAVQVALYTDILERRGRSAGRMPFIWDILGRESAYPLDAPPGPRSAETLWGFYERTLRETSGILDGSKRTEPAMGSGCKLCRWRSWCRDRLVEANDLTLIPELGRERRDSLCGAFKTVGDLARADLSPFLRGDRTAFHHIGPDMLRRFHRFARLQAEARPRPYLTSRPDLPASGVELFFDVETDPMRDLCYLHGFLAREGGPGGMETYRAFFSDTPDAKGERMAFSRAAAFVRRMQPCVLYFYSKYERTQWRLLRERYREEASEGEIEAWLNPPVGVDLYYDVLRPHSVWPTHDYSIKTLAVFLGFHWRDAHPSGAESIEWYNRWIETGEEAEKRRILEYNEDDCRATRVLLDAVRTFPVREGET